MPLTYLSVCSGIEAATVAWHPLGWTAAAFAEIDPFACAVLRHHYPEVPNVGDFTAIGDCPADVLVGGTPCQDFSVAGLRAGLAGARGHLTLEFLALAGRARPRWLVWENVPGVLSADHGWAFGTFLGLLGQLGYGWAYRVLDAQHFGVPQRRRRVFVVGHLGDWRRAAAVLFERHCLSGHPPPRREAGERVAATLKSGARASRGVQYPGKDVDNAADNLIPSAPVYFDAFNQSALIEGPVGTLDQTDNHCVAHSLRADGFDSSEDGTGRGTPIVVDMQGGKGQALATEDLSPTLGADVEAHAVLAYQCQGTNVGETGTLRSGNGNHGAVPAVAFSANHSNQGIEVDGICPTLNVNAPQAVAQVAAVRRLMPVECERLQGFPDDYTLVPYRGKPAADGPRYRALGNSMAVPVMAWIGKRIQLVEEVAS